MDINSIDDIKELKSMAYDQAIISEQAQENLRVIQKRIYDLENKDVEHN